MVEPLLAMGEAMATLIDYHHGGGRQIVQQAGRLAPGHTHQPPHALGGAAFEQLVEGLGA